MGVDGGYLARIVIAEYFFFFFSKEAVVYLSEKFLSTYYPNSARCELWLSFPQ